MVPLARAKRSATRMEPGRKLSGSTSPVRADSAEGTTRRYRLADYALVRYMCCTKTDHSDRLCVGIELGQAGDDEEKKRNGCVFTEKAWPGMPAWMNRMGISM